jgi:hypothetical protein
MNNNIEKNFVGCDLLFLLAVFLFSLGSYYFYQVGLYVFQIIGVLLLFPLFRLSALKINDGFINILLFFFYIFVWGVVSAIFTDSEVFNLTKFAIPVFVFFYFAFSVVAYYLYPLAFHRALYKVIWLHVWFFIVQFSWFQITATLIDYLEPITGEQQRAIGGSFSLSFMPNFVRSTGLFNEPGTYSNWIITLLLLFKSNVRRLGMLSEDHLLLTAFVIGTVLLSFSAFGYVFSTICVLGIIFEKKINITSILLVAIFIVIVLYFGAEFFGQRSSEEDSSVMVRVESLAVYLAKLSPKSIIFGYGMFTNIFIFDSKNLVYHDVGLWFGTLVAGGVIGYTLLFSFFIFCFPKDIYAFILLVVIFLSKCPLTSPLVWVVFFYFLLYKIPINKTN